MNRKQLPTYSGWTVELTNNGETALWRLYSNDENSAFISPCGLGANPAIKHILTDAEIAGMKEKGFQNLFSLIER